MGERQHFLNIAVRQHLSIVVERRQFAESADYTKHRPAGKVLSTAHFMSWESHLFRRSKLWVSLISLGILGDCHLSVLQIMGVLVFFYSFRTVCPFFR